MSTWRTADHRYDGPGGYGRSRPDGPPAWVQAGIHDLRAPLEVRVWADPRAITGLRRQFAAWLAADVPPGQLLDDVVLAVYEALANTAEHAYPDTGAVHLRARRDHAHLQVTVTDYGHWLPPTIQAHRGRGITLMQMLTQDLHIERGNAGTIVNLLAALPPPSEASSWSDR